MTNGNGDSNDIKIQYEMPRQVGIIYSEVKREYFPTEVQYMTEKDAFDDAKMIGSYLEKMGIQPILYPATPNLSSKLMEDKPNMVFNLTGSVRGWEYLAATIPGILEMLDIPYTGAGILGESLAYNKFLVKKLLQQHGVPVPNFQLFPSPTTLLELNMRFPLISKLNEIHGSVEVTKDAISENEKHLRERLKFLIGTYKQPVLVEEFIVGKEVTAILLEGLNKKVYIAEKIFPESQSPYVFATFDSSWTTGGFTYQKYPDPALTELVKKAFEVTRMTDYGKFDIRIDPSGRYYFIDANSNPAFGPKETDCAIGNILEIYGIPFTEVLKRIMSNTMRDAANGALLPMP
jgi:D-alanine-D-alanine ligase